jgi:hypothetical protein
MSLASLFFQKELHLLSLDDITTYFSEEQEETSTLEFKSGEVGLEKVHIEVCAFLNTEGGILILGTPREKEKNKCIGAPTTCTLIKSEHSLMQSIAAHISPSPVGLKCKAIPHESGFIYVIEAPQSMHPPHQVSKEGKYYIRLDKEAKAAPHGIVEALFMKRQRPSLAIDLQHSQTSTDASTIKCTIKTFLLNTASYSAEQVGMFITVDKVRSVINVIPKEPYELNGETLTIPVQVIPGVLVKDLSFKQSISFIPSSLFVFISCIAWCKDGDIVYYKAILDITIGKLHPFLSTQFNSIDKFNETVNTYSMNEFRQPF